MSEKQYTGSKMPQTLRGRFSRDFLPKVLLLSLFLSSTHGCIREEGEPLPAFPNTCLVNDEIIISDIAGIPEGVTFDKVKAEISGVDWEIIATVEAAYDGGEFVLRLPVDFASGELCKVARDNVSDYSGFWPAKTNNPGAKVAGLGDIFAYDNGEQVGRIYLSDWSGKGSTFEKLFIYYHYADQPFTLSGYNFTTGNNRKTYLYEASFRQGWNAYANISQTEGGIVLCTTSIPVRAPLVWRFQ